MGAPALFVENLCNVRAFSGHVLEGNEEGTGTEAFRVADGRRTPGDYWAPTTLNAQATLTLTCDRLRTADMLALDRGHNLGGKQIKLELSGDNFTTSETVLDLVLPTVSGPASLDGALGVRTEEGAWLRRFPARAAKYWRLTIPAMGTGLKPQIVGWWLGLSYTPNDLVRPHAEHQSELIIEELTSALGWVGRGVGTRRRLGMLHLRLSTTFEYELARYHLEGHYAAGRLMWIVFDDAQAERSVLAQRPTGPLGFELPSQWFYPTADVGWVESQPKEG